MKTKYNVSECSATDPFIVKTNERFAIERHKKFLISNTIVLKSYISPTEKGVILVKYTELFNILPFLFDLKRLQQRYHFILEPSSESPYHVYFKFFPTDSLVFIQSLSERESAMSITHGFIPLPVCAADWIMETNFVKMDNVKTKYDFAVIANFIPVKRHDYLFDAVKKYWKDDLKFALVASTHVSEKKEHIEALLDKNGLKQNADFYLNVPHEQVNLILNESKCHVLCSLREGANKANFESLYIGTPVVVHKDHIGFPNYRFKYPMVVNYTNQENLVSAIKTCATINKSDVRDMAQQLIGSKRATEIVNEIIKSESTKLGYNWTVDLHQKVNIVHAYYFNPQNAITCKSDYEFLETCILDKKYYSSKFALERFGTVV